MELKKNDNDDNLMEIDSLFDPAIPDTVSKDKRKYSDDYSRSGSNIGYAGTAITDYDEAFEKNAFQISQQQMNKMNEKTTQQLRNERKVILIISEIIVYISCAYAIFCAAMITAKGSIDIYFMLPDLKVPIIIMIVCMCFDALMVCMFHEKKISLFIFAIFLSVFYPLYRSKAMGNAILIGLLGTMIVFFSFTMLFVNVGQRYTKYGIVVTTEDELARHSAYDLMNQIGDNGQEIGPYLMKKLDMNSIMAEQKKGEIYVSFSGTGSFNIDNMGLDIGKKTPTTVTFVKENDAKSYSLNDVKMNGASLNLNDQALYWSTVEEKKK